MYRNMALLALVVVLLLPSFDSRSAFAATEPAQARLDLSGTWRFTRTDNPAYADPSTGTDGPDWTNITAPQEWAAAGYGSYDGYAWYKRQFTVPAEYNGIPLIAVMGYIDDADEVFFNGVKIGATGALPPAFVSDWYTLRQYAVPASLINFGDTNTIAIRMYDGTGGGGIHKGPFGLFSKAALRSELGLPDQLASSTQVALAQNVLATQQATLARRDLAGFLATIDQQYVHNGHDRSRLTNQLQSWIKQYATLQLVDEQIEVLVDNGAVVVDTTRTLLGINADGSTTVLQPTMLSYRYFKEQNGTLLEIGNHSRFFEDTFYSAKMGETRALTVYLPRSYYADPTRHYATVYLLHGFNGRNREWFYREMDKVIDRLVDEGSIAETIVVMPDANNSWYINSPDGKRPYQDMIVDELIPFVDAHYRTKTDRLQRGLTGVSMGGFGAFNIGLNHPDLFGSVASHMGALNFPPFSPECSGNLSATAATYCQSQTPTTMVAGMLPDELKKLQYYFDSGTEDDFGFYAAATEMHGLMEAKGVPHEWYLGPGKHDDAFWLPQVYKSFQLHMRVAGNTATPAAPDLVVSEIAAKQNKPKSTVVTATISNNGTTAAKDIAVRFNDGGAPIGETSPVVTLEAGESTQVSLTWNTTNIQGERVITAIVDPRNVVAEAREDNNETRRTVTLQGNKVQNGSFEQSANGSSPDAWSGSSGTQYDTSGTGSSDGSRSVSTSGDGSAASLRNPSWTSAPIEVIPGESYTIGSTIATQNASSSPQVQIAYLDKLGTLISTANVLPTPVSGTAPTRELTGRFTIPTGVSSIRLTLLSFSPTDLRTGGTIWFDDVWMMRQ